VNEVAIASFSNEAKARLWSQVLAENGIRSVIVPLGAGAGLTGTSAWQPHELRVLQTDADEARRLLEGLES
jgi:hypothetical protein